MSLAQVWGAVPSGVSGVMVRVEVDVAQGLPTVGVVGLAQASVAESRWRARSAIVNSGFTWPNSRITIGLSPADLPKTGTSLDLPIAVGILVASGQLPAGGLESSFVGELGLDGVIKPVSGALAVGIAAHRHGVTRIMASVENARELCEIEGLEVVAVRNLQHVAQVLAGKDVGVHVHVADSCTVLNQLGNFDEVRGHEQSRFALEVAAAGGHHLAMIGEPGVGKTMLAQRFVSILPDLTHQQALDVTSLHSLAGRIGQGQGLIRRPPLVAPHHSISAGAMVGSVRGGVLQPGALSLANHGVLFLDEAPEFARPCLEGMRQPLELGTLSLMRVGQVVVAPAQFQLLLAANPCPCGKATGTGSNCKCDSASKRRYMQKLSGPLMDRIDIRLTLSRPTKAHMRVREVESSEVIAQRVRMARERSAKRWSGESWVLNAQAHGNALRTRYAPSGKAMDLLTDAENAGLNPRGSDRVLRMSWTLADLDGVEEIQAEHIALALSLRGESFD
ncbi:MAG: YifB family Mg chelatase-like AAA ATPase [Candidatus Nanopelagicales bacterium]|nr:YifB family Mg chelatase-like AAA ATPase [Candidatus Nanopelagicales bacterium]